MSCRAQERGLYSLTYTSAQQSLAIPRKVSHDSMKISSRFLSASDNNTHIFLHDFTTISMRKMAVILPWTIVVLFIHGKSFTILITLIEVS